jgi:hypothetical protein
MATSDPIQAKIEAFVRQLGEEFGEIDEENALSWLDAIETRAVEIGDAVTAELLKRTSADRPVGQEEAVCPKCGKLGRYRGQRERELVGRRGPVVIAEPEYYCACCRESFFPEDHNVGR